MDLDRFEEVEDVGPDWSVSRLQTIFSCGKKYHYKYIEKVEEPPTVALAFGSAVHKCLETAHWQNRWDDTFLARLWSDTWFEAQVGIDWDTVRDRKSNKDKKGLEILEAYRDTNVNDEWYAIESHFRFDPTPGRKIIEERLPVLRGTFDKIEVLRNTGNIAEWDDRYDGRLAIIDYKTSKNPPDRLLLRVDPQLTIYHRAALEMFGEDVILGIHHLLTNTIYLTERTERDMDAVLDMIREGVSRVEEEKFERNISYACKWCPFKEQCLGSLAENGA